MSDPKTTATYDQNARAFFELFSFVGTRIPDVERALSFVSAPASVLELGCGHGREAKAFLDRDCDYTGVDVSSGMLEIAREEVPDGTFVQADISTYAFPAGVDLVISFACLLHVNMDVLRDVLARAYDSLEPGGVFYLSLKIGEYRKEIRIDDYGPRTFYYYEPDDVLALAGDRWEEIYRELYHFNKQDWFTMALRKNDSPPA